MMPGYHLLFREHARRIIEKEAAFPDVRLGIAQAEDLKPQQQEVFFGMPPRQPEVQIDNTIDSLYWTGTGKLVSPEDFPQDGYTGRAIYDF